MGIKRCADWRLDVCVGAPRQGAALTSDRAPTINSTSTINYALEKIKVTESNLRKRILFPDYHTKLEIVCLRQAIEGDMEKAEAADKGDAVHGNGTAEEPESVKDRRKEASAAAHEVGFGLQTCKVF